MHTPLVLALLAAAACTALTASAAPATTGPAPQQQLLHRRGNTCTPTSHGSASQDDVPAIRAAIQTCSGSGGVIVIPAGTTYMVGSPLSLAGCNGCEVQVEGTLKVTSDPTFWSQYGAVITASGGATGAVRMRSVTGTGLVDGNGQAAWDAFAANASLKRPTLFAVKGASGVRVGPLYFKNAPNVFHSTDAASSDVAYDGVRLKAVSASANVAHNTDGWDVGGKRVTLTGCYVENDDDCVAFKPGADTVTVDGITCVAGHGLSVGSLGKSGTDTVQNVVVKNAVVKDSTKAVGIKLYPGGSAHGQGVVRNVTFDGVVVDNSDYAVQIQSCYGETAAYCSANPSTAQVTGVTFRNFTGTTSTKYDPNVSNIDCPAAGTCGVTFSLFGAKAPSGKAVNLCANSAGLTGITCTSGASG